MKNTSQSQICVGGCSHFLIFFFVFKTIWEHCERMDGPLINWFHQWHKQNNSNASGAAKSEPQSINPNRQENIKKCKRRYLFILRPEISEMCNLFKQLNNECLKPNKFKRHLEINRLNRSFSKKTEGKKIKKCRTAGIRF